MPASTPVPPAPTPAPVTTTAQARHRLAVALSPRRTRTQAMVGLLFVGLGFALAAQVRAVSTDDALSGARQEDLVRILDGLDARNDRLTAELRDLEDTRDELRTGTGTSSTAVQEARDRAQTLGILAGTIPATGPGVVVTVRDPAGQVDAASLLDAVQELRDAGAEAIQLGPVRVVAQTALVDGTAGSVVVDGTTLRAPYEIVAIGDPRTMAAALRIPGGVIESLRNLDARVSVQESDEVTVSAVRAVPPAQ